MTPLAFNIFIGSISIWDLGIVQEVLTDNHNPSQTEHEEPCFEAFPTQETQDKQTIEDEHI